ncbi:MAG: undecaprenyl-diphosphate phosphatase [Gammaproteobacteria bacterium]|nr:undecaprenyl-diphosphate phosphatase [Gammaproteobacteria bacterium]
MDLLQIVTLALMQGLTEFLPVSSSAHLILTPVFFGWEDQGLAFDVAVHVGTLLAVVFYFRTELKLMSRDWLGSVTGKGATPDSRLAWAVLLGTIPVGIIGLLCKDFIEGSLRSPLVIAVAMIFFGALLWWADSVAKQKRDEYELNWKDVLFIGLSQAMALIPGTSRSGATMTAALLMGLTREAAARFSFLLSIPVILLAGGLKTLDLIESNISVDWFALGLGIVLSALSAYLCIHLFLKWIQRMGLFPFVLYRFVLGAILLLVFW